MAKTVEEKVINKIIIPPIFSVAFLLSASSAKVWLPFLRNNKPQGSISAFPCYCTKSDTFSETWLQ